MSGWTCLSNEKQVYSLRIENDGWYDVGKICLQEGKQAGVKAYLCEY
jgi:hypothetical protein